MTKPGTGKQFTSRGYSVPFTYSPLKTSHEHFPFFNEISTLISFMSEVAALLSCLQQPTLLENQS